MKKADGRNGKMRKFKAVALTAAFALLCGCTEVKFAEGEAPSQSETGQTGQEQAPPASITVESKISEYKVNPVEFEKTLECEAADGGLLISDDKDYSGDGYIEFSAYGEITFDVEFPTTQFYGFDLTAFSEEGGTVSLIIDGTRVIDAENGEYKRQNGLAAEFYQLPQSDVFSVYSSCPVYLENGEHKITLQTVNGTAALDRLDIKNTEAVSDQRYYAAGKWISGSGINSGKVALMDYFKEIYGEKTLTAQYVTPDTNAEIEAIAKNTGRFPAIRASDLRYYTESGEKMNKSPNRDIQLALSWANNGGLVCYSWYWYTPMGNTTFYLDEADFDMDMIISDNDDIVTLNTEELGLMLESGSITEECYKVLCDMDAVAAQLSTLAENGVTVLFKPLPQSGAGWYWWERDAELYKWLWQTMHTRFDKLHGLSNLIWVYTASADLQSFPGDDNIDIIGCDVYNSSESSNLSAMLKSDAITLNKRMLALSECCFIPDPDIMARDNAVWLWAAPWNGKYLINEYGELSGDYITVSQLKKVYNHELTIARDELPDFS